MNTTHLRSRVQFIINTHLNCYFYLSLNDILYALLLTNFFVIKLNSLIILHKSIGDNNFEYSLRMFISKQRNPTLNINEFTREKQLNVNNSLNVNMNNDFNTSKENRLKIIKSLVFHENRLKLKNWLFQLNIYFIFNFYEEKHKTLFAITRMKEKIVEWIKLIIIQHLSHERDFARIFFNYNNFKREVRIVFKVINEVTTFKRIIQYLTQKTFATNYAQRFKIHFDKIN